MEPQEEQGHVTLHRVIRLAPPNQSEGHGFCNSSAYSSPPQSEEDEQEERTQPDPEQIKQVNKKWRSRANLFHENSPWHDPLDCNLSQRQYLSVFKQKFLERNRSAKILQRVQEILCHSGQLHKALENDSLQIEATIVCSLSSCVLPALWSKETRPAPAPPRGERDTRRGGAQPNDSQYGPADTHEFQPRKLIILHFNSQTSKNKFRPYTYYSPFFSFWDNNSVFVCDFFLVISYSK